MAEQDSTTKASEKWEWLSDLLNRVLWPMDGLIKTMDEVDNYDDFLAFLVPMVDGIKTDLDIINEVLAHSFGGQIKIETTHRLRTFGAFRPNDFKRAFIEPAPEPLAAVPEGGK